MTEETRTSKLAAAVDQITRLGGLAERTRIDTNLEVIDATGGIAGAAYIIIEDQEGYNVPAVRLSGVPYTNGDLVNVLYVEGTEPVAFQQGSGSVNPEQGKVSKVWQPDLSDIVFEADGNANLNVTAYGDVYAAGNVAGNAFAFTVENTSGGAVVAGDVGYIDEAGEFKTTTTAQASVAWAVVLIGGADSGDIYVTRRGRATVNYTGSAPSAGDYLVTSATAGDAQAQSYVSPAIFAVCTAAGSGGTVEVQLLTNRLSVPVVSTNNVFQVNSTPASNFVSTVDSLPGGAVVRYDTPSSGAENAIVPGAATELAHIVLHNTTRGDSADIETVNTTGGAGYDGEITLTAAVPGTWQAGDTITTRSQTNTATFGTGYYYDYHITSMDIPPLAVSFTINANYRDTNATGTNLVIHPYQAIVNTARQFVAAYVVNANINVPVVDMPIINRRFTAAWNPSAATSGRVFAQMISVTVAAP